MARITRAAAAAANQVKKLSPSVSPALQTATLVKQEQDDTKPPKRRAPSRKEETSSSKRKKTSRSNPPKTLSPPTSPESEDTAESETKDQKTLSEKKFSSWSRHAHSSPFPDFIRPTVQELKKTHDILESLHGDRIREEWADPDAPSQDYPYVMDALVVAALSQATSWANAKRAMKNMKHIYGSTFAYDAIVQGGIDKLRDALRPGGLQNRKSKILMDILYEVKKRYGKWDLQFLFNATDEEAVKEVVSYKGLGPKCAFCLLSICLKRDKFAVDTHIFRIAKLWGWCPQNANKETAQAHLDARIPNELKFALHYHLIAHGSACPRCRGNGNPSAKCEFREIYNKAE
ncbi:hypothetical protein NW762_012800 [Fusarium torreyae]|uniref:HhH-GPD domain-containing protein n=1 Tax=Fusarium torreyae TaxID=1237075 RepID=A0A9W8RNH1_9HYPO|nr:hypothetical protein NW762_012800 [Fusarium torreyae]